MQLLTTKDNLIGQLAGETSFYQCH